MNSATKIVGSQNEGRKLANSIAMIICLISFTMLFAVLFLAYGIFRSSAIEWPPMGMQRVDLFIPSVSTLIICLSSLTFWCVESLILKGQNRMAKVMGILSLLLGVLFVGSQFVLWEDLKIKGIYQGTGIYASLIYGFTWTHVGHIVLALFLKAWLMIKVFGEKEVKRLKGHFIKNVALFWHFLGIVWILIYVVLFVL
jgi:cytochrome c oxidase subunit 3